MATENVSFILGATDQTKAAFGAVRGSLNGLGEQVVSVRGIVGTLTAALGVGAFGAGIKAAAEAADAAAKMGDRFGIATEKLIGMQHAGELAGVSNEALTAALKAQAKSVSDAARGSEEAAKAYGLLGIKADEFIKLPMDRQFSMIVDKLGAVENVTLRNAIAQEVFGKGAGQVMGIVAEGSEAFKKATADAEAWGLAVNRVDAAKLEMALDAIKRAQDAAKGLFTTIAVYVAPIVQRLASYFADTAAETKGFKKEVNETMESLIKGAAYAVNALRGVEFGWAGLKLIIAQVADATVQAFKVIADNSGWLGKVLGALPGPLGLVGRMIVNTIGQAKNDLQEMAGWTSQNVERLQKDLEAIALRGLIDPEELLAKFRKLKAAVQKEAEEIARRREDQNRGGGDGIEKDKAPEKKQVQDTWRDKLAQQIERLREENMTELQLLDEKLMEKNVLLQNALEAGLITEEAALAQSALIKKKYEEAKTKIEDEETKKRYGIAQVYRQLDLASAGAFFGAMAGLMNSKSRTMFNIGKAAAIGETVIETYRAAQGAYASLAKIPIIGPALGIAAAAAAVVSGIARVQQIRSTQFGGGAVAAPTFSASPTTGVPTEPISPLSSSAEPLREQVVQQPRREINITFQGSGRYTQEEIRDALFPALNEALGDGLVLNVH